SCASTASISTGLSRDSKVSKNTMRRLRPKPVKYALPCAERFEPSITNKPLSCKPHRSANALTRSRTVGSCNGVNLLNRGAKTVGKSQITRKLNATHTAHAHHTQ